MIDGFLQNGMVEQAKALFDQIACRKNVSWMTVINAYLESALVGGTGDLLHRLPKKSIDDFAATLATAKREDTGC